MIAHRTAPTPTPALAASRRPALPRTAAACLRRGPSPVLAAAASSSNKGSAPAAAAPNLRRRRPSPAVIAASSNNNNGAAAAVAPRPDSPAVSSVLATAASIDGGEPDAPGSCPTFIDRDGEFVMASCCDFGWRTGKGARMYADDYGSIPKSAFALAMDNFNYEYAALRRSFREDEYAKIAAQNPPKGPFGFLAYKSGEAVVRLFSAVDQWLEDRRIFGRILPVPVPPEVFDPQTGGLSKQCQELRAKLKRLTLSNEAVWERERKREAAGAGVETPLVVKIAYLALCYFLDFAFNKRPIPRFWFLETVARCPYFSYVTVLHLYETLGWWRAGIELRRVHAAQELNEAHHLAVCESLGGDQLWSDRFLAQHSAVIYYIVLVLMYLFSPKLAYNFSELIEAHAVDTYTQFAEENEALLKELPPPYCAAKYYRSADLSLFDQFQTRRRASELDPTVDLLPVDSDGEATDSDLAAGIPKRASAADSPSRLPPRRPLIRNLYDVFCAIAADEGEHVATMTACIDGEVATQLRAQDEEREATSQALLDLQRERRAAAGGN